MCRNTLFSLCLSAGFKFMNIFISLIKSQFFVCINRSSKFYIFINHISAITYKNHLHMLSKPRE
ncbi:hypothetical protein GcM3_111023 [Golovinomyces cichoracearum]|uniref:Uncharacterized protein n=1 Tax=Golovinomyces cichoracearum TaxID=62708 RepID=A0A420I8U2_9PEZI|nr:hypothetical protein GcM3_111023 [Golovinomyces cichoracearum]